MKKNKEKKQFTFTNNEGVVYKVEITIPYELQKCKNKNSRKKNARTIYNGTCEAPSKEGSKISLHKGLVDCPKPLLGIAIEEFTHAFFWGLKEKEVRPFASKLAQFLYKAGFRLEKPDLFKKL